MSRPSLSPSVNGSSSTNSTRPRSKLESILSWMMDPYPKPPKMYSAGALIMPVLQDPDTYRYPHENPSPFRSLPMENKASKHSKHHHHLTKANKGHYRCRSDGYCYYSTWDSWGRWTFVAGIVILFLLFFLLTCISARRRRRRGMQPFYGTGWLGGAQQGGQNRAVYTANSGQPYYAGANPYPTQDQGPAPQYTPPAPGYYANQTGGNGGYYGGSNNVELQSPPNAYQPQQGGAPVYAPPPAPAQMK
ncbi:MAG: hypothetical protein M1823_001812 [Watsoniomyces obsoletus]|nr:MAG: hypothetical protein M1823_001812 [Watsoniomyces obsoletus]